MEAVETFSIRDLRECSIAHQVDHHAQVTLSAVRERVCVCVCKYACVSRMGNICVAERNVRYAGL